MKFFLVLLHNINKIYINYVSVTIPGKCTQVWRKTNNLEWKVFQFVDWAFGTSHWAQQKETKIKKTQNKIHPSIYSDFKTFVIEDVCCLSLTNSFYRNGFFQRNFILKYMEKERNHLNSNQPNFFLWIMIIKQLLSLCLYPRVSIKFILTKITRQKKNKDKNE